MTALQLTGPLSIATLMHYEVTILLLGDSFIAIEPMHHALQHCA